MQRRDFLRAGLVGAGGLMVGNSIWARVFASHVSDAPASSYGALELIDPVLGVWAPPGFTVREVARANTPVRGAGGLPVGTAGYTYPIFPDGSHVFPQPGGGWILVVNSENPPGADFPFFESEQNLGGASAIKFAPNGTIIDAYWVLENTRTNCAGGHTPWGTWLSCEEFDETEHVPGSAPPPFAQHASEAGQVWECDPTGQQAAVAWPQLGHFKHEAAAFDDDGRVYLTEDIGDGCLYRFTPDTVGDLGSGTLDAMVVSGTSVSWTEVADPTCANGVSTREQGVNAERFDGGEGCWHHNGVVYFTTKGDDKVWAYDLSAEKLVVVYGDTQGEQPLVNALGGRVLNGVDNIIASEATDNLYVAEDGDNMEIVVIEETGSGLVAAPLVRLVSPGQGAAGVNDPSPVPIESEITGLALGPGNRLYFSSQREYVFGATYELVAPKAL